MQNTSISTIFEMGEDGKYTDNALLYQYILSYPILVGDHTDKIGDVKMDIQVSLRDMIKWLIITVPEFKSRYSGNNISKTVLVLRRRIKRKLEDLVHLELLLSEKKKQKLGEGTTSSYTFTIFGQLLGWIIYSNEFDSTGVHATINYPEIINKQIFNLLQQIFKAGEFSPTIDIVASNFISECMQLNAFRYIVNLLRSAVNDQKILIDDVSDLLHNITTCNFKELNFRVIFTRLWNKTITKLDPRIKNLVLYNLKLAFEQEIQNHVRAFRSYERMWFDNKNDHRVVALECSCTNCEYYTPVVMDVMQYKERKFYSKIDLRKLTPLGLDIIYYNRSFDNYYPTELSAICKACNRGSLRLSFPD